MNPYGFGEATLYIHHSRNTVYPDSLTALSLANYQIYATFSKHFASYVVVMFTFLMRPSHSLYLGAYEGHIFKVA